MKRPMAVAAQATLSLLEPRSCGVAGGALLAMLVALPLPAAAQQEAEVEQVSFRSTDGKSTIVGYLFKPANAAANAPAVVMLHGRSGAYSSLAEGRYDASTLTKRHKSWGQLWAREGYYALMVDDFGPLGYPEGFGRFTYNDRPPELDEVAIRPLHAYGALRYLRSRPEIDGRRIGLMGWSNGGSATLAAMADDKVGDMRVHGFRAALSLYPGCGLKRRFQAKGYKPYAPVRIHMGSADEEVSPKICEALVERSRKLGGDIEITLYRGAEHSYDSPVASRQKLRANSAAKETTETSAIEFFARQLKTPKEPVP